MNEYETKGKSPSSKVELMASLVAAFLAVRKQSFPQNSGLDWRAIISFLAIAVYIFKYQEAPGVALKEAWLEVEKSLPEGIYNISLFWEGIRSLESSTQMIYRSPLQGTWEWRDGVPQEGQIDKLLGDLAELVYGTNELGANDGLEVQKNFIRKKLKFLVGRESGRLAQLASHYWNNHRLTKDTTKTTAPTGLTVLVGEEKAL